MNISSPDTPSTLRNTRAALAPLLRIIALFLVSSLGLFFAVEAMPEDPVSLRIKNPDPARVAEIRQSLGLDDPIPVRYARYLGDFARGDWGRSLITGREVRTEIGTYLPATLELGACALLLGTAGGLVLALSAAWSRSPILLRTNRGLGALGLTVPIFWIGIVFVLLFSVALGFFPVGGRFDYTRIVPSGSGFLLIDTLAAGNGSGFASALQHLALPVLTLSLYPAALVAGTVHARLEDERIRALVRALHAKGLSPANIWFRHILRLVSAPVVTIVGTNAGALFAGAVLTETVFSWPGMGRFIVDGVLNRDVFVISNGLLLVILLAFAVVAASDLLSGMLDPRARRRNDGRLS